MPISPKTLSRVFRTAPAKAAFAVGGAALATGALLAYPANASASAATNSANLVIRPSHPFPSFPVFPSTQFPSVGTSTFIPVRVKKSSAPQQTQGQFNYVSTFSPAPVTASTPASTASAACVATGQPVSGAGDLDLPGINGASKDAGHVGALPINTLGPTAMLPPQIDSTNLGQLKVTRPVDATSANLAMVASSGYRFPCVHIEIGAGQGFANAEYALVNAGLVADDRSGTTEILTWTYSTILWSYTLPGSADVHQGSGEINAQPDKTSTSLATDSKAVAAGTIGLGLVVSLGLVTLYIVGKRRNRARYRARYYRRAAARARREAVDAAAFAAMQPVAPVEPGEIWEPQRREVAGAGEPAEVGEPAVSEPGEVAEPAEATAAESVEPVEFVETAESVETAEPVEAAEVAEEREPESAQEPESEPEPGPESEPEAEPEPVPASEADADEPAELTESPEVAETEHEAESTESDVAESGSAEPEADLEPEPEVGPEPEVESEPASDSDDPEAPVEPVTSAQTDHADESESGPEPEPDHAAEAVSEPEASPKSERETEPAEGDAHEPAAAH